MKVAKTRRKLLELSAFTALAAAGIASAAPMSQVVTARLENPISQHLGRESVYAMQTSDDASRYAQVQHADNYRLAQFWDQTKDWTSNTWDRLNESTSTASPAPGEPRRYGRAGGYSGWGRVEQLEQVNGPESETVKQGRSNWLTSSGEPESPYASGYADPVHRESSAVSEGSTFAKVGTTSGTGTAMDAGDGRGGENRFDYHHQRHGQAESIQ